jgi:hypothetical protein
MTRPAPARVSREGLTCIRYSGAPKHSGATTPRRSTEPNPEATEPPAHFQSLFVPWSQRATRPGATRPE